MMQSRLPTCTLPIVALAVACSVARPVCAQSGVRAQGSVVRTAEVEERRETERVVREAIDYFASQQSRSRNGSMGGAFAVASTSRAGLALLGAGIQPGRGDATGAQVLERCVGYILGLSRQRAFITEPDADTNSGSRMHGHCYAVLFLTQISGALPPQVERDVATAVRRGVKVIEHAQSRRGGWYYYDRNEQHQDEASVTVCALQALRAARNTGFEVDASRVADALRYIKQSQVPSTGGVVYSLSQGSRKTTFSLTAAAVSTLNAAGVYESRELRRGLAFLQRELDRKGNRRRPGNAVHSNYFYYGNLYAAQALFQEGGAAWRDWYPKMREQLLSRREGGHWKSHFGDVYATAMALLILEMPLGYLPVFQR